MRKATVDGVRTKDLALVLWNDEMHAKTQRLGQKMQQFAIDATQILCIDKRTFRGQWSAICRSVHEMRRQLMPRHIEGAVGQVREAQRKQFGVQQLPVGLEVIALVCIDARYAMLIEQFVRVQSEVIICTHLFRRS